MPGDCFKMFSWWTVVSSRNERHLAVSILDVLYNMLYCQVVFNENCYFWPLYWSLSLNIVSNIIVKHEVDAHVYIDLLVHWKSLYFLHVQVVHCQE